MSVPFTISRVDALPAVLTANTMYIIRDLTFNKASITFVGNSVEHVSSILTYSDVEVMIAERIAQAINDSRSVKIYKDIESMRREVPTFPVFGYVQDTSGDPLAQTATGAYVYSPGDTMWLPLPAGGGGGPGDKVTWEDILGRPSSTAAQIDQSVAESHVHPNMNTLDKIGESNNGLTFNGVDVRNISVTNSW